MERDGNNGGHVKIAVFGLVCVVLTKTGLSSLRLVNFALLQEPRECDEGLRVRVMHRMSAM